MMRRILFAAAFLAWLVPAAPAGSDVQDTGLDTIIVALSEIQRRYVNESKVATDILIGDALKGMAGALDYESMLVEPAKTAGDADLGITVGIRDSVVLVLDVDEGSAAAAAGLAPGCRILRVDGEGVSGRKRPEVEAMLRGAAGSRAMLLWANRANEYREASFTRSPAGRAAWRQMVLNGVLVLEVRRLDQRSGSELGRVLANPGAKITGVVLDLRRCSGGDPAAALELAGTFFGGAELLAIGKGLNPAYNRQYPSRRKSDWVKLPVNVVTGPWTQGAAEIVAGALQAHRRGLVVGEPSFGFACRQKEFPLSDGSGRILRLTVERFLTPLSASITGRGISPDLATPPPARGPADAFIEKHRVAERFVERMLANPPAEYDAQAIRRGELKLSEQAMKGKSVIEQKGEFEQAFQISLDDMLRSEDYEREYLDSRRSDLISRVTVLLAKHVMRPEEAQIVAAREDTALRIAADSLRAMPKLGGEEGR